MPETIFSAKVFRFFCSSVFRLSCCLLFFSLFLLSSLVAFALLQDDGTPCPPECVTDSMEIVTWYPSPWNAYDELRSNRIVVGGGDAEKDPLPPPWGTIVFKPLQSAPVTTSEGTVSEGMMYYDSSAHEFRYSSDGSTWKPVGGSGMESSDVSASSVNVNTVKGYTKVTVNGQSYAMPYYTYGRWLSGSKHVDADCAMSGGVLVGSGSNKFCKFSSNSCPSGWNQYNNWSTTKATRCAPGGYICGWGECTTGYHSWSDATRETCVYTWSESVVWSGGGSCDTHTSTCTAEATDIGCY